MANNEPRKLSEFTLADLQDDLYSEDDTEDLPSFDYEPYEFVTKFIPRFDRMCQLKLQNEDKELTAEALINIGLTVNIIPIQLQSTLDTKIVYGVKHHRSHANIGSYFPEESREAIGTCKITITIQGQVFKDVTFHVVKDIQNIIPVVLGHDFFESYISKLTFKVGGPFPPMRAVGAREKVILPAVGIGEETLSCARLDTGTDVNLMCCHTVIDLGLSTYDLPSGSNSVGYTLSNTMFRLKEYCICDIVYDMRRYLDVKFYVVNDISESMVFGMDFILQHKKVEIKYEKYGGQHLSLTFRHPQPATEEEKETESPINRYKRICTELKAPPAEEFDYLY